MQHDEHIWTWRWYRQRLYGFYAGLREIGISGPVVKDSLTTHWRR